MVFQQTAERLRTNERDIAVQHGHRLDVAEQLPRLERGVTGAQHLRLHGVLDGIAKQFPYGGIIGRGRR